MSLSVMPDLRSLPRTLIRGHPERIEKTGFRLEFIPMEIGAGMTSFSKSGNLWTDSNEIHKDDLLADWELASTGRGVFPIDPLK